jgi:hypothetical protein
VLSEEIMMDVIHFLKLEIRIKPQGNMIDTIDPKIIASSIL